VLTYQLQPSLNRTQNTASTALGTTVSTRKGSITRWIGKRETRLVRILPGKYDDLLRCDLTQNVPLDNVVKETEALRHTGPGSEHMKGSQIPPGRMYFALSYAAGRSHDIEVIEVCGCLFMSLRNWRKVCGTSGVKIKYPSIGLIKFASISPICRNEDTKLPSWEISTSSPAVARSGLALTRLAAQKLRTRFSRVLASYY
jgi:hypothetical protein